MEAAVGASIGGLDYAFLLATVGAGTGVIGYFATTAAHAPVYANGAALADFAAGDAMGHMGVAISATVSLLFMWLIFRWMNKDGDAKTTALVASLSVMVGMSGIGTCITMGATGLWSAQLPAAGVTTGLLLLSILSIWILSHMNWKAAVFGGIAMAGFTVTLGGALLQVGAPAADGATQGLFTFVPFSIAAWAVGFVLLYILYIYLVGTKKYLVGTTLFAGCLMGGVLTANGIQNGISEATMRLPGDPVPAMDFVLLGSVAFLSTAALFWVFYAGSGGFKMSLLLSLVLGGFWASFAVCSLNVAAALPGAVNTFTDEATGAIVNEPVGSYLQPMAMWGGIITGVLILAFVFYSTCWKK